MLQMAPIELRYQQNESLGITSLHMNVKLSNSP